MGVEQQGRDLLVHALAQPACGGRGLAWSATDAARVHGHQVLMNRLTTRFPPPLSPNPFVLCKNFINKSYRATCKLQLCFREEHLICHG